MPISARNLRIGGATLIAVLMVAGGYVIPGFRFPKTKPVNAELTDELLASYVSKDTDVDGLPDWQEALYGTDANRPDTDNDGIIDGEAVRRGLLTPVALASQLPSETINVDEEFPEDAAPPDSVTDQFSRAFFQAYIQESGGQPMSADAQQALLKRLIDDFNARASAELNSNYSAVAVRTDTFVTVQAYASSVERILAENAIPEVEDADALSLMQALIQNDDVSAVEKLERIARAHRGIANGLLATRVPLALAEEHLELMRAFDTLGKSVAQIAAYKEDPLSVLGALAVYRPAAVQMDNAYTGIATEILKYGEPMTSMDPGYVIVYIARF